KLDSLLVAAVGLTVAACAVVPTTNPEVERVRGALTALQSDANLGPRAPVAIGDAEQAVRNAEQAPADDSTETAHRVYLADKRVQIARAQAEQRYAEDQFSALSAKRDQMRLEARTLEADTARARAEQQTKEALAARSAAEQQAREAQAARTAADQARVEAEQARATADQARAAADQARKEA